MKTKRSKVSKSVCLFPLLAVMVWAVGSVQAQTIGKTIDQHNYKEFEALLAPAQLRAIQKGEWTFPTGNLKFPLRHSDRFLSESEKNAGKFDVDGNGHLIDKTTGTFPEYNVYGFPFPKIDPKDPNAGVKIMWNFNYQKYRFISNLMKIDVSWVAATRHERYFKMLVYMFKYQGRPLGQEIKVNPQKFLYQDMGLITEPMDLKGVNTMTWEYLDLRDSSVFSYIPVIRRVRRTSGAARSDPYMGTDGWWDVSEGWAGKNASFTWKLLGERMLLVPFLGLDKQEPKKPLMER